MIKSLNILEIPRPHPGQVKIFKEHRRFNVLECGRRWGKTTFGLRLICASAVQKRRAAWFAPTQKLASEPWIDMKRILAPITAKVSERDRRIETRFGGIIDLWSLDNPDSGRGRKYHRIIIDEASIVRDLRQCWQESLRPTLTDYQGQAWFLGTPRGRNYFHELFTKGQADDPDWKSWRLSTFDNPHIDSREVEVARRDLPEAVFGQEYLAQPADDGGNPFGIEAIRSRIAPLSTRSPVAFGVDLAKTQDWTVAVGLDAQGHVCRLERWRADWGQIQARLLEIIGDVPACIDSSGVGDPIVENLQRVRPRVSGFRFLQQSKQQLMERLGYSIVTAQVHFPAGWLVAELESFECDHTPGGTRYSAPSGLHDDGVCALALAIHQRESLQKTAPLDVRVIEFGR